MRCGPVGTSRIPARGIRYRAVMSDVVERYVPLMQEFVDGAISADAFQDRFLALWRDDRDSGRTSGEIIDNLMTGVDCYDQDPDVIGRIDDEQLKVETQEALGRLGGA